MVPQTTQTDNKALLCSVIDLINRQFLQNLERLAYNSKEDFD